MSPCVDRAGAIGCGVRRPGRAVGSAVAIDPPPPPHPVQPRRRVRLQARARTARRPADHPRPAGRRRAAGRHGDRRRRRRVAAGRRPGAGRDHRLLHPARRRRPHLGPDRRARTPSRTSTRWAGGRCSRSTWWPGRRPSCRPRCSPRCSPAARRSRRSAGSPSSAGTRVDDPEPKYGLAVVGEVHPDRILRNSGLRDGDALVLTKPLGIGITTTAIKAGVAPGELVDGGRRVDDGEQRRGGAGGGGRRGDGLHRRHRVRAARTPDEDGRERRASTPSSTWRPCRC